MSKTEWKFVLKEIYRTTKQGGCVYLSTLLEKFDLNKAYAPGEFIKEIIDSPSVIFYYWKIRKAAKKLTNLFKKGVLSFPTRREIINLGQKVGFERVEIRGYIYKKMGIILKMRKPESKS